MENIIWEEKKAEDKKAIKTQQEILSKISQNTQEGNLEKEVAMGFSANQFIVRLPSILARHSHVDPEKAKNCSFKFKWNPKGFDSKTKTLKGEFTITTK